MNDVFVNWNYILHLPATQHVSRLNIVIDVIQTNKKNSEKENEDTGSPLFMSTRTKTGAIGLYREHGALDYFGLCKQRKVQKVWERINIDLRVLWIMNRATATSLCS